MVKLAFFTRGWRSLVLRNPNGGRSHRPGDRGTPTIYSVAAATLAPKTFPASFMAWRCISGRGHHLADHAGPDRAELKGPLQTSAAIKSLLGLAPKTARRINTDGSRRRTAGARHMGDLLRIRPGERCLWTAW